MTKRAFPLAVFASAVLAAIHTGPEVGTKMPDFQAVDQDGKSHTMAGLLGPKGAVIVVYRSADW